MNRKLRSKFIGAASHSYFRSKCPAQLFAGVLTLAGLMALRMFRPSTVVVARPTANRLQDPHATWDAWTENQRLEAAGHPQRPNDQPLRSRIKVLFAVSRHTYETMTDAYFAEEFDACRRHPHLECSTWGPGFRGYDPNMTLYGNLAMAPARIRQLDLDVPPPYDVIMFQAGYPDFPVGHDKDSRPPGHEHTVHALRINEGWGNYNEPLFVHLNISIAMYAFAQDMAEAASTVGAAERSNTSVTANMQGSRRQQARSYGWHEHARTRVNVHVPMSTDIDFFDGMQADDDLAGSRNRSINALLVGAVSETCYPMRARLQRLIQAGRIAGGVQRSHPGYRLKGLEERAIQRADYAQQLRSSKIVFVTSMFYRHRLQKFAEAAAAGALMMGTLPQEEEELFRGIMVELREDDSDDYIIKTVKWWIDNEEERLKVVRRARAAARRYFSWDLNYAERLLLAYNRLRRREFGWWFPVPFTVREPRRNVCDCNARKSEAEYVLAPRCAHVPTP